MLKNYTVIVKNVDKDKHKQLLKYLNDNKHKNHTKKETEIYELGDANEFEKITEDKLKKNEENYYKNGKGGKKLKVVNKSFTFNLPKSYKEIATVEKCKEMDKLLKREIIKLLKQLNIEIGENELYSVLHHQDNPHIHLVLPYLDRNGNTIRDIKPKGFTSRLKVLFSQIVDKTLDTEIKSYKKLDNEANGSNKMRLALEEIKDWYLSLIRIDKVETKYYKNQIIAIDRRLEQQEEITQEQLNKIVDNMKKASNMRKASKKTTPSTPYH